MAPVEGKSRKEITACSKIDADCRIRNVVVNTPYNRLCRRTERRVVDRVGPVFGSAHSRCPGERPIDKNDRSCVVVDGFERFRRRRRRINVSTISGFRWSRTIGSDCFVLSPGSCFNWIYGSRILRNEPLFSRRRDSTRVFGVHFFSVYRLFKRDWTGQLCLWLLPHPRSGTRRPQCGFYRAFDFVRTKAFVNNARQRTETLVKTRS